MAQTIIGSPSGTSASLPQRRGWAVALGWALLLFILVPWVVVAAWLTLVYLRLGLYLRQGLMSEAIICFASFALAVLAVVVQAKTLISGRGTTPLSKAVVVVAALPPFGVMLLFALFFMCDARDRAEWGTKPFTSHDWRSAPSEMRHLYVNDLLRSKTLASRPRDEVLALLGTPDREEDSGERWDYTLKYQDCSVDHWLLSIKFYRGMVNSYGPSTD